jgi:hypothetical protein
MRSFGLRSTEKNTINYHQRIKTVILWVAVDLCMGQIPSFGK